MVNDEGRHLVAILVVGGIVLTFAYSLFVAGMPLLWLNLVSVLLVFYLLWRFVRAHERIADALEQRE
ncbi:hypothetical protein [Halorhabdus sp. CUG00001]|uniref:hypothetical protein n=1 Tax=Halorhabdus sp. CUG00001 TaxID=2600297 RepID=UPI00131C5CC3|nr:hypothetical protein [Halorhabdus sp. CUG00001]